MSKELKNLQNLFSKNMVERWLPHLIGLLLFLILPVFVFNRNNVRDVFWMYNYYYQLAFMIVAFYGNYLFIVPRFFFSKRKVYFFLALFLFVSLLLVISQYLYEYFQLEDFRPDRFSNVITQVRAKNRFGLHPKLIDNFLLLLIVIGFSSGMAITQQLRLNEAKQKEIEKARVDSELAFLRNQISPHFFFNALNNIYGLIAIDSDKAQKAVEKLSGLMRYLIYDSNIEVVDLKKEFDFTLRYIELMQQRLSSKVKLDIDISKEVPDGQIPPLLFLPFIENAFKHGISYRENSFISIALKVDSENVIFSCSNSIPSRNEQKSVKGGLGIENIKKRLALIFRNSYKLDITQNDKVFSVLLVVPYTREKHIFS
ncbi:sensor histidine kinase [Tenuifilum thalassicum]|nr:histidine kinase [Tenuifilum thalassicum]